MTSGFPNKSTLIPLSDHARGELEKIAVAPLNTIEINAGVLDRFLRGRLVEIIQAKSPFKSHHGRLINHAKITDAGLAELGLVTPAPKKRKTKR